MTNAHGSRADQALVVVARSPVPGKVKTRLAAHLGERLTADLYACFVEDTLAKFCDLPGAQLLVSHTPCNPQELARLRALVPDGVPLLPQRGGTFGERLCNALGECREFDSTVLIGTDSPTLPPRFVGEAFEALSDRDTVIGPATDGGYYLLGVRTTEPELFKGIEWSTSSVLSQTLDRCRQLGHSVAVLPPWYDVDEPEDLEFLRGHLAALALAGQPSSCPKTCRLLAQRQDR